MKLSLHCPICSKPIAELNRTPSQVSCPACQHQYGVVYGKLSKRSSIHETLLFLTRRFPQVYKRHYTLQITTPERTLKQLQFSIPGRVDPIPVHYGDIISVLYTMHGYVMQKLVAITNHTTGKSYVLPTPVLSTSYRTVLLGTGAVGLSLIAYLSGINVFLTALTSSVGLLTYLKLGNTAELTSPELDAIGGIGNRLLADQKLLTQKRKIDQRIEELGHDSKSNQLLIQQLETLKQKMMELDQQLYSERASRVTNAIRILKQQIENNARLVREYGQTLKMIDIEIETSWIADQLPEANDFTRKILQRLQELKTIEEQNQDLKLQLAAYEEIGYGIHQYE